MPTAIGARGSVRDPAASVFDRPTALVAVLAGDPLLNEALVCAVRSASTRTISALDLSPLAPQMVEVDAFLVVPGPDPRRLGAMLATLRRQSPAIVIVALSLDEQRLVSLAAEVGTPIHTAGTVDEALMHIRQVGASAMGMAEQLTPRHLEILNGVARGVMPSDLAVELGISMKTMNNHLGAAYRRLGVDNLTQAMLRAHNLGLIRL